MVLFIISSVLVSCGKEFNTSENNNILKIDTNPLMHFHEANCNRLYSESIIFGNDSLYLIGNLHNHILDSLLKVSFNLNDYLNNDFIGNSIFGTRFNEYYINKDAQWFCNVIYMEEISSHIENAFQDGLITQNTRIFLHDIALSTLNGDFDPQVFYNRLILNPQNGYDYLICGSVFSIAEYSNCYWSENIKPNRIINLLAFDCLAGIGSVIRDFYDSSQNNWQYDADTWIRNSAKSAAWGSTLGRFGF